jgi:hypothetical protein
VLRDAYRGPMFLFTFHGSRISVIEAKTCSYPSAMTIRDG